MKAVIVIRRRAPGNFPQSERNQVADALKWSTEAVDRTLVGAGWAWLPGSRDSVDASAMLRRLSELNMRAGVLSEADAGDVGEFRAISRASATQGVLKLHGAQYDWQFSKESPGGATLLGIRWDGESVRPYGHVAERPGVLFWDAKGPLGVAWLREERKQVGLSAAEMASFLKQGVVTRSLSLVDDSYRPDDVPAPHPRFAKMWTDAEGAPQDTRVLLHAIMVRALHKSGALTARESTAFSAEQPLKHYDVVKRKWVFPATSRVITMALALGAAGMLAAAPGSTWTTLLGAGAGAASLTYGLHGIGRWLRLKARPLSKILSMAVGPVHVEGTVESAMQVVSPMRGLSCVYYLNLHQRRDHRNRSGWRTVSRSEAPHVPFYLRDATGRVLVDSLGAEFNGLETYIHRMGHNERIREWVLPTSITANIYGFASVEPGAPVVQALLEGLETSFLVSTGEAYDINQDGVLSSTERQLAGQALRERLRADRSNVTLHGGMHLIRSRREPLVITTKKSLPLGLVRGLGALFWILFALVLFISTFVFPAETSELLRLLIKSGM